MLALTVEPWSFCQDKREYCIKRNGAVMSILRSILVELLTLSDHEPYIPPTTEYQGRDYNGYSIYKITAANYDAAARLSDGYTVEGPVYKSLVHVGRNQWQLRVECNDVRS